MTGVTSGLSGRGTHESARERLLGLVSLVGRVGRVGMTQMEFATRLTEPTGPDPLDRLDRPADRADPHFWHASRLPWWHAWNSHGSPARGTPPLARSRLHDRRADDAGPWH